MTDKIALEKETDASQILSGMELVIGKKDGTIDNASIPVRWCLTKPLMDLITASSYNMPQIIIQVNYESERDGAGRWYNSREERHIFSLNQFIAYVPLSRPGRVVVSAYLVGTTSKETKCYSKAFLSRDAYGSYLLNHLCDREQVYSSSKTYPDGTIEIAVIAKALDYAINIPLDLFGKKPPTWLWNLINRYQDTHLVDQCQLRRRYMMFPLKLPTILIELLVRQIGIIFVYCVLFLVGFTGMPVHVFTHPLTYWWNCFSPRDLNHVVNKYLKAESGTLKRNIFAGALLMYRIPAIPLVCISAVLLTSGLPITGVSLQGWITLLFLPLMLYMAVCIIALIVWLVIIFASLVSKGVDYLIPASKLGNICSAPFLYIIDLIDRYVEWLEEREQKHSKAELLKLEKYLTCNGDPHSVTAEVDLIPLKDQTPTLIYTNLKNKVCRPLVR